MKNSIQYLNFGSLQPVLLLIARILLVVLFIVSGFPKILDFNSTVQYMASLQTPMPWAATLIAIVIEILVSILIVIGFYTRPLALIFAFYTLGTAIIGHAYWTMTGDQVAPNMINFYKNISIIGGFILLAIVGPGSISLDKK